MRQNKRGRLNVSALAWFSWCVQSRWLVEAHVPKVYRPRCVVSDDMAGPDVAHQRLTSVAEIPSTSQYSSSQSQSFITSRLTLRHCFSATM